MLKYYEILILFHKLVITKPLNQNKFIMKNFFTLITATLLLLGITLQSCSEEPLEKDNSLSDGNSSNTESLKIINKIKEMGYNIDSLIDFGSFYIVEGDIKLSKNINDYTSEYDMAHRQYQSVNLVADEIIGGCGTNSNIGIKVYCQFYTDSRWTTAIDNAINDWNNAISNPSRDLFTYTTNANEADIIIKQFPIESQNNMTFAGLSGNPSCGRPYFDILIETDYVFPTVANMSNIDHRRNLIGHELGHAIGFKHSDVANGNGTIIPGTEFLLGTNSIMNSTILTRSITGLTSEDILATQYLYGCNSTINPESAYPANFNNITITPKKYECNKFNIKGNYEICTPSTNIVPWATNQTPVTLSIYDTNMPLFNTQPLTIIGPINFTNGNFNFSSVNLESINGFVSGNPYYAILSMPGITSDVLAINYTSCIVECTEPCNFPNTPFNYSNNGSNSYTFSVPQSTIENPCSENYTYAWSLNNQIIGYGETITTTFTQSFFNQVCLGVSYSSNGVNCKLQQPICITF